MLFEEDAALKRLIMIVLVSPLAIVMHQGFVSRGSVDDIALSGKHTVISQDNEGGREQEPVYGEPSSSFRLAREKYPAEYKAYARFYAGRRGWSEFTAPGIPIEQNSLVMKHIRQFQTTRRVDFASRLKRAGTYLPLARKILVENGLPGELVCLAMVESGFDQRALSRAKAAGPWQFMPETARMYGLRVDGWVDDRMDLEKSTMAASRLLLKLYGKYHSWDLVIAAYNSGEKRVDRITSRTGSRDFWKLAGRGFFSTETRYHLIKFHAAVTIMRDLDGYGFADVEIDPPLLFEKVETPAGMTLDGIAHLLDVPQGVLKELNPQLVQAETPPDVPLYPLRVPVGIGEIAGGNLPAVPVS